MKDNRRIIIVGPAAAGKTYIKNKFISRGFDVDVSYTTRPMREGEADGVDYHFTSSDRFSIAKAADFFYECAKHGDYWYGTGAYEWNASEVFIMETEGISKITPEDRKNCLIIYVNTPLDTRIKRMKERGWDADNIMHRMNMDDSKFDTFADFDIEISS
jgi:guanylate kinase